MSLMPYLFFDGRCEEAIDFYKTTLGATVETMMRFKDNPEPPNPEACGGDMDMSAVTPDKIMHASFSVGGATVMASDGMCTGKPSFSGFSLSVDAKDEADADRLFGALAEGGTVQMPLARTFFSPRFGMVADRFGVSWMVIVDPAQVSAQAPA